MNKQFFVDFSLQCGQQIRIKILFLENDVFWRTSQKIEQWTEKCYSESDENQRCLRKNHVLNDDSSVLKIAECLPCINTGHGCSCFETAISIEIHAMRINYQSWNILKNLFESLNQSGVFIIIAENIKDVNPGMISFRISFF